MGGKMTVISVTNTAGLRAALSSAQRGDRIELAPANYGDVDIGGNFASDVMIVSARTRQTRPDSPRSI